MKHLFIIFPIVILHFICATKKNSVIDIVDSELNNLFKFNKEFFFIINKSNIINNKIDNDNIIYDSIISNINDILYIIGDSKVSVKQFYSINSIISKETENFINNHISEKNQKNIFKIENDTVAFYLTYFDSRSFSFYIDNLDDLNKLFDWILKKYLLKERIEINDNIKAKSYLEYLQSKNIAVNVEENKCQENALIIIEDSIKILENNINMKLKNKARSLYENNKQKLINQYEMNFNKLKLINPFYILFIIFFILLLVALIIVFKRIWSSKIIKHSNKFNKSIII